MKKSRSTYIVFFFSLCFLLLFTLSSRAQVWQWSVMVPGGINKAGDSEAFLWIAPNSERIRAVIFAQNNMEEISILEHPDFRSAISKMDVAEIWVSPSFNHLFNFKEGAGESFNTMMKLLAKESGYAELNYAPVIALGHSATASAPYYFAVWNPERTLAAISVSGQWPYFRHEHWAPNIWDDKNIDFIPCLETMGEYESAATWSVEGLKERVEHPNTPLSMLACPAEGHFAATDKKIHYLCFYIKKVLKYRLPKTLPKNTAPELIPIDPTKTGWLMEKWTPDAEPPCEPAPVDKYQGDSKQAFWFFDEEHIRETQKYQSAYKHQKALLLGVLQNGKTVKQKNTHQQVDLQFQPMADGITFTLSATFLDTVPGESPRPSNWSGLPAGSVVSHPKDAENISINKIIGPFEKVAADTFRLAFERGFGNKESRYELWFTANYPGNDEYKPAVQQAKMVVPLTNQKGKEQLILFDEIKNQNIKRDSILLTAVTTQVVDNCLCSEIQKKFSWL